MVINKTRFSENPHWAAALNERAKLLFGDKWEYDATQVLKSRHSLVDCLSISQGETMLAWRCIKDGTLSLHSGDKKNYEDPTPEIPSHLRIAEDGVVLQKTYYHKGVVQDPTPGVPAYQNFYESGALFRTIHFKDGKEDNPSQSSPAEIARYETGEMFEVKWWCQGLKGDNDFGMPARITYTRDGDVSCALSTVHGLLDQGEAIAIVADAQRRLLASLISSDKVVALSGKCHNSIPPLPSLDLTQAR